MKYSLDLLLNKMSMYRLLSVTLSILVGFSIFLSLFNQLPYTTLEMITSASVLVMVAYASNVLLGKLFGVRTHDESSYITALILFFIVSPSLELKGLAALGLVAAFAMASKFIVAVHGRHIFNPAAFAAALAGAIGLAYATWWIATPILLPLVAFLAFLILYKTRRLQLGAIFLVIASGLIFTLSVLDGQSANDAGIGLLSWPLVFFAGFMLSEPLTLPPRHWQQYSVGIVVAILFAIPMEIGGISSSPAFALLVGNAIAFLFTQKRSIRLTFMGSRALTPTIYEFTFKSSKPLNFTPGQYMEITLPHKGKDSRGIRRPFSIIGVNSSTIKFAIKIPEQPSSFKRALLSLTRNDVVNATGINGDFVLPNDSSIPLLFVAGGVGITPFISFITSPDFDRRSRNITLLYSVTTPADIIYADELNRAGIRVIIVTKTNKNLSISSWDHLNALRFTAEDIVNIIPDVASRHTYISGPPNMVDTTKKTLRQLGTKHIKSDYFTGY